MCLQCSTKSYTLKTDIIPGYFLMRGRIHHDDWPKGYYALVRRDDPDYIWENKPIPEPQKYKGWYSKWKKWAKLAEEFEKCLVSCPELGYDLQKACMRVGYRPKTSGRLGYWLFNHLGKQLKRSAYVTN